MQYHSRMLDEHDEIKLQNMLETCNDYFNLVYKRNNQENSAHEILTELPDNKTDDDKFVIGIFDEEKNIIGVIDIIRDYPQNNIWFLGLMLISPNFRSNGLGKKVFDDTEEWAVDLGAKFIRLAVVEQNIKGLNFWKKLGFKIIKDKIQDLEGIETKLFIMEKSLN